MPFKCNVRTLRVMKRKSKKPFFKRKISRREKVKICEEKKSLGFVKAIKKN